MKHYHAILMFFISVLGFSQTSKWTLRDCIEYAKNNNLTVQQYKLNEQSQEFDYKISQKQKLPSVSGNADTGFSFGPQINTKGKYDYTSVYTNSLGVDASIQLYNGGNLKLNEQRNKILLDQKKLNTLKMTNDISLQIIADYMTVLLNKELEKVSKNSLDISEQQLDRNQKLYNAGSIAQSTLYESKATVARDKANFENAKIEVERAKFNLALLLQTEYNGFDVAEVTIPNQIDMPLSDTDQIAEYANQNQPEIKSAELGVASAEKEMEITKTLNAPTLTGNYRLGTSYADYFNRKDHSITDQWWDNHSQTVSIGVTIPIFNKGINKIKIQQSQINQQISENALEQEKLTLRQTIQTAYFDVKSAFQQFESNKESVESTKISYDFSEKSFTAGKINIYDLNTARNNYFNALSQMLQSKYQFLFKVKVLDFYAGKPLDLQE